MKVFYPVRMENETRVRQNSLVLELDENAAPAYIAGRLGIDPGKITATSLGGGISNHVVLIETPDRRFVLKQSLPKLRVEEDWFSDRDRIFRESSSLRKLSPLLPAGTLPEVVFEDRDRFAYAMTAAPASAQTWKAKLMSGVVDAATAEEVARIQASIMQVSWHSADWENEFGDLTAFEQLRLNPYYEVTASRHPELAPCFARALERCRTHRCCLVHGDWSPKNMMVDGGAVMAIDFEVIHYGDPSFDCAFLLNHLLLKSFHLPPLSALYRRAAESYWNTLSKAIPDGADWLEAATLEQLPLLLLARVDGKSPAEYIRTPESKARVRQFAIDLLNTPARGVPDVFERLDRRLE